MGEYADYANDEAMDEDEARLDYRMGLMSDVEAYERGIIDELGAEFVTEYPRRSLKLKTCRCCQKSGLVWSLHQKKWRLFDGDKLHECPENPLT